MPRSLSQYRELQEVALVEGGVFEAQVAFEAEEMVEGHSASM